MIQAHDLIEARRSVRAFQKDGVVTRDQIQALLRAAMLAPSACNDRQWSFVVVQDRALLEAIRRLHPYTSMLETAQLAIVVMGQPGGKGADFWPQDCAAATQNILLQATALQLGACWCGVYPKQERMQNVRDALDLPRETLPFSVIAVGVPAGQPAQRGFYQEDKVLWK